MSVAAFPLFVNGFSTTLASSVASGATTTFSLASVTGLPTPAAGQYIPVVVVDTSTTPETVKEIAFITAISGTTATVTRAAEDSARFPAAALASGLTVAAVATSGALTYLSSELCSTSFAQTWTIPVNTFTDVPGMTLNLPAGVPMRLWTKALFSLSITSNLATATAVGAQLRIVDQATSAVLYSGTYGSWMFPAGVTGGFLYPLCDNIELEALTASVGVKLQAWATNLTGFTPQIYMDFGLDPVQMWATRL